LRWRLIFDNCEIGVIRIIHEPIWVVKCSILDKLYRESEISILLLADN